MSMGALLIGLASLVALVAYVAQPFRRSAPDVDTLIERWVADVRQSDVKVEKPARRPDMVSEGREVAGTTLREPLRTAPAAFCHNCGKPVNPDHRFCRNCGARLDEV